MLRPKAQRKRKSLINQSSHLEGVLSGFDNWSHRLQLVPYLTGLRTDVSDGIYVFGDMGCDCVGRHFATSADYGLGRVGHVMTPVQPPYCFVVYGFNCALRRATILPLQ